MRNTTAAACGNVATGLLLHPRGCGFSEKNILSATTFAIT